MAETDLMSRDEFRRAVFARDRNRCVVCGSPAQDAHHIVERRLWPDGGYYLDNGASVCGPHHLMAESTELSCGDLRAACGIARVVLPPHLYADEEVDKWGNPVLQNGQRLRGELFHDESVQKVLAPVLHLFTDRVKYPRTYHLPWSPSVPKDDKVMPDLGGLDGEEVVVTLKMDGEQTTMLRDGFHARSLDTPSHPSRDWLWSVHREVGHEIPPGWRVCGENLYAVHSIRYLNLAAPFQVFSVWDDRGACLSWDETVEWAALLGLATVAVLWRGMWDEGLLRALGPRDPRGDPCEGYVVRAARSFRAAEFRSVVGKWVRAGHVQTHGHWMRQAVERNLVGGAA
jgi:hypothetical protein